MTTEQPSNDAVRSDAELYDIRLPRVTCVVARKALGQKLNAYPDDSHRFAHAHGAFDEVAKSPRTEVDVRLTGRDVTAVLDALRDAKAGSDGAVADSYAQALRTLDRHTDR